LRQVCGLYPEIVEVGGEFGHVLVQQALELEDAEVKTGQIGKEAGAEIIVFHEPW
jgi:hypothetical protein